MKLNENENRLYIIHLDNGKELKIKGYKSTRDLSMGSLEIMDCENNILARIELAKLAAMEVKHI